MSDKQTAIVAEPADAEVRLAALDLRRHIIAVAPAGSGKTGLLVQRMLAALATVDTPEQVVAMTFTNKAAAEIRNRVLGVLQRAAASTTASDAHDARSLAYAQIVLQRDAARDASQRWSLIANPERLRATTIDGLQAQIAAELPLLSGLGGRPRVVEDAGLLYEDAVLALFAEIEDAQAPQDVRDAAATLLRAYGNRADRLIAPFADLLARREQWQYTLAADFDWLAHERQVLEAIHVAAQEHFTDQFNASEQAHLLAIVRAASLVEASLAPFAAIQKWPQLGAENAAAFVALTWPLLTKSDHATLRKTSGLRAPAFAKGAKHTKLLRPLLEARIDDTALENAARALRELPPAQVPAQLVDLREALRILLLRLLGHLRAVMGERGETDFVGIAEAARAALRPRESQDSGQVFGDDSDNDSVGSFGYGDALLRRDAQLRHLLVDEMQDTSESQLALLRNLTLSWSAGDGRSLFLVGDPQQSIYAFRKAEVRLFQQLLHERRLGDLPLNVLRLSANFRSEPTVVEWFNAAFERIFPNFNDALSGAVAYSPSIAARPAAADETKPAAVNVYVWSKDGAADEAHGAARTAAAYAETGASVAILVRARSHVRATLVELRALGVRAACQDVDPLAELPAVRDVLALARALWHPEDRLAWAVLLRAPFVGLSWADMLSLSISRRRMTWPERLAVADFATLSAEGAKRVKKLLDLFDKINADHARAGLPERVEILWTALGGPACVDTVALGDVRRTFALIREHASQGLADARRFERAVAELYAAAGDGAVQVMTIHKAKGLEFDHVIMVGAGRGARQEDRPLLHLTETPHGALLVPKPPRHWPQDAPHTLAALQLYDFTHALHARVRSSEGLRLLYVAATRARRTLDICFCADVDKKTSTRKPKSNSFAEALLKGIDHSTIIVANSESITEDSTVNEAGSPPRAPRLPVDFVLPAEDESTYAIYMPQLQRSLRPSEAVLSAVDDKRADDDIYAQLVGTLFHQALEKISRDGIERWNAGAATRASALAAGFRRLSLPEPQVEPAVSRVLELVARTLASTTGRWIVGPHPWARSEYALAGYRDGRWFSALLDRCFETAEGELWIVDYKTSARTIAADAVERYIAQSAETYRPQLMLYSELLTSQRPGKMVTAALYFPEGDRLLRYES